MTADSEDASVDLQGKVAVVTGGAVRLGRAISLALAGCGARVVVHYGKSAGPAADTQREIAALGAEATTVSADLSDPRAAASTIFEHTQSVFGTAHVLVNSAAIFEPGGLATTSEDAWDRHHTINLKAPFLLSAAFVEQLGTGEQGQIVNIADWRATRPAGDYLAYTAAKAGLVAVTKNLALELAPRVRVNAIAPGAILPPPDQTVESLNLRAEQIPLQRPGSPSDVTAALLYLLRADYVTGAVLHVTGGEEL